MDALRGPLQATSPLATGFTKPTWAKTLVLVAGVLLCLGSRTVANRLRALGLDWRSDFRKYHWVPSRAPWSGLSCARILLGPLVRAFAPGEASPADEPLVFAVDETIERRWGRRIRARGIYRDAVRSSAGHFAKASGLRWVCLTLVTATRWTPAPWALPVLTALCPSARYYAGSRRAAKALTDVAR